MHQKLRVEFRSKERAKHSRRNNQTHHKVICIQQKMASKTYLFGLVVATVLLVCASSSPVQHSVYPRSSGSQNGLLELRTVKAGAEVFKKYMVSLRPCCIFIVNSIQYLTSVNNVTATMNIALQSL